MLKRASILALALGLVFSSSTTAQLWSYSPVAPRAVNSTATCNVDRTQPPVDLTSCPDNVMFNTWRPKARFTAPSGWLNDPMGMFQRSDGVVHAGYQCHPQHIQWGNISQCSAFSNDMVYWTDAKSWQDPRTIWPSEIYDIRGVFDGTVMSNGWNGHPTIIYTSTFTGPLGSGSPEGEGAETQSLAYTTDGGESWIKLNFGYGNNPVIYQWPDENLTGFRDPYVFPSPYLEKLLANSTSVASGPLFLTLSSGMKGVGPRLWLYRQTNASDPRYWTFLGPLVSENAVTSFSEWSGNFGINFETASVTRLNETGRSYDDGSDPNAINIVGMGTEGGRGGSHEGHWPIWLGSSFATTANGSVQATVEFAGVSDWGRAYAFVNFPYAGNRQISIGWVYEDDETLALAFQRGYQGCFSLFRDLFLKVIHNVDPATPGFSDVGSWTTRKEADGSTSVVTVGQKVVPEITTAYKKESKVSNPASRTLNSTAGYVPFEVQPTGAYYAVSGVFDLIGDTSTLPNVGFRVLASSQEYTDIYYSPSTETLTVDRTHNSLIASYGTETEQGKLRLWDILANGTSTRQTLNLTVFVDNSVVEVYANDVTVITTRVYPWLQASVGAGFLVEGGSGNSSVVVSEVELWDGLLNAWPKRPNDTSQELLNDGPLPGGAWGDLWAGN